MLSSLLWKLLFLALGIAAVVTIIVLYIYKTNQSIKYEKRITDFALSSISDSELSLFDRLTKWLWKIVHNFGQALVNLKCFKRYAQKYEKYIPLNNQKFVASDFLSLKFLVALALTILNIISSFKIITLGSVVSWIITFGLSFYLTDIVLNINYNRQKQQLKNEITSVVSYINNSLAAGNTIYQTVDLIANDYDGFISNEFAKVANDLNKGLNIEEAFERLNQRVDIKEINYISSTLKILDQNGGRVIEVFKIIEKDLLNQKTIKDEIKLNLIPLKMIYNLALILPILVFIAIKIFYPQSLLSNFLNIVIIITLILLYILYIIIIHQLLKEGS